MGEYETTPFEVVPCHVDRRLAERLVASYHRRVGLRRPALAALGVVSALALGAADSGPGTAASSGGTLRVVALQSPPTLDPALTPAWGALWYATCATLMAFRDAPAPEGSTVQPEAAADPPEVSSDGRTYVFTVRKGLRFSDGTPLRAANFARALGRVRDLAMGSPGAELFSDIEDVDASGRRLRIELRKPSGDLPMRLALPFACPVPLGFPVDPAGVPLMVGSGPYRIAGSPNGQLVLARNRNYRGPRPHRIDRIVLTVESELETAIRAVEEGRADAVGGELPFETRDSLARRYGVNKSQLFQTRGTVVYYLALNTSQPLFRGNVALRKAVNLALDRTEIVKASPGWPLSQTPTGQIIPRWVRGWVDHRVYPLSGADLKRAKSLANGNLRGGKAALYTSQAFNLPDVARVIARQLGQIGLEVAPTPLAPAVINARAGTPGAPYDMLLTQYGVQYPDPADVLVRLLAGENARRPAGNTNFAYFDNSTYNRRMAAAQRLTGSARLQAFSKLDAEIMRTEAPWAPLYEGSRWQFISTRVGCVKMHPVFKLDFAAVCLR
jgi:peptide/nickel transport system substrate-binding protein